jgi:protein TonB
MEINRILNSDLLDIIFEGRNKDYGAYELRKTYNNRLAKAFVITFSTLLLLLTGYLFASKFTNTLMPDVQVPDYKLVEIPPEVKPEVIVPPKPKTEIPKVETIIFTPPRIVTNDVPDDQKPPEINTIEDARIGLVNTHGIKDDNIENAPIADGYRGIITPPKSTVTDEDRIFLKVEIESFYPAGVSAWARYLNKTFKYPTNAQELGLQGTVVVQFIVDKEGKVSNVEAISGPDKGGLKEEAVRVIMKSGKWEAAIQNGTKVRSYKRQPITFQLVSE